MKLAEQIIKDSKNEGTKDVFDTVNDGSKIILNKILKGVFSPKELKLFIPLYSAFMVEVFESGWDKKLQDANKISKKAFDALKKLEG